MRLPFGRSAVSAEQNVVTLEDRTNRDSLDDRESDDDETRSRRTRVIALVRRTTGLSGPLSPGAQPRSDRRQSGADRRIDQLMSAATPTGVSSGAATRNRLPVHPERTASNTPIGRRSADNPSATPSGRPSGEASERPSQRQRKAEPEETKIDVLYENQRGSYLCGVPMFSPNALWFTDPHAWTTADMKYSPFDIWTATVPDPTWEYCWSRWMVDMTGDKDENGWEYSILFSADNWHGHHVYWHSFCRRRRWLRKYRRKAIRQDRDAVSDRATLFSSSYRASGRAGGQTRAAIENELDEEQEEEDCDNIATLLQRLRRAPLDRQKLAAVEDYLTHGTDLAALAGEMEHVVGFFIYQQSRRHLLQLLRARCGETEADHIRQIADHDTRREEKFLQRRQIELLGLCNTSSPRPSLSRRSTARGSASASAAGASAAATAGRLRGNSVATDTPSQYGTKIVGPSPLSQNPFADSTDGRDDTPMSPRQTAVPAGARDKSVTPKLRSSPRFANFEDGGATAANGTGASAVAGAGAGAGVAAGAGAGMSHRDTCLLAALHEADRLVRKLNYYSDRQELVQDSAVDATDHNTGHEHEHKRELEHERDTGHGVGHERSDGYNDGLNFERAQQHVDVADSVDSHSQSDRGGLENGKLGGGAARADRSTHAEVLEEKPSARHDEHASSDDAQDEKSSAVQEEDLRGKLDR